MEFNDSSFINDSKITFMSGQPQTEFIRLEHNGDIYVKGKLVTNDMELVNAMRAFLIESGHIKPKL